MIDMKYKIISLSVAAAMTGIILGVSSNVYAESTVDVADENTTQIAKDSDVIASGSEEDEAEGKYCSWYITSDGVLHIEGGHVTSDGSPFGMAIDDEYVSLVTTISFDGVTVANSSTSDFFKLFKNVTTIEHLENFDTSNVTDMSGMFYGLTKLKQADLGKLDTSNVENMSSMFKNTAFENFNLANWDVKNVNNVFNMFNGTPAKSIDVSGWQVDSLDSVNMLFSGLSNLTSVKMFKDFKNISNTTYLFMGTPIENIDTSDWNMSNVKNMFGMFAMMPNLSTVDASNWQLAEDADMTMIFSQDPSLKKLDLSKFSGDQINLEAGLALSGLTQITTASTTDLSRAYLRVKSGDDGSVEVDENGNPIYEGYWVKVIPNGYSELVPTSEFILQKNDGTFNHVNPEDITTSATIKSNKGDIVVDNINISATDFNSEIEISVPDSEKADKQTVKGKLVAQTDMNENTTYKIEVIDPDGEGKVTYEDGDSNSSNNNSNNNSNSKPDTIEVKRLVATHPDGDSITLYTKDMQKISNRALAPESDWFSDQEITRNGEKYYRVAENEWVKASDVYAYEDQQLIVKTNKVQQLVNSKENQVTNRALSENTSWQVDRLAKINDKNYYRVATNEFVLVDDI